MRFSVLIPAFNARDFIEEALDSVAAQTLAPAQIVVVDDGSVDATGDAVVDWSRRTGVGLDLIRQENQGVPVARNRGMAAATGDWIALLDADDVWLPEHLATLAGAIGARPQAVAAFGDAVYFSNESDDAGPVSRAAAIAAADGVTAPGCYTLAGRLFETILPGLFFCPSSTAFRHDAATAIGGFDAAIRYIEDRDFFLRLSRRGAFVFADKVISRNRLHDNNITHPKNAVRNAYFMLKLQRRLLAKVGELRLDDHELELIRIEIRKAMRQFLYTSSGEGLAAYMGALARIVELGEWPPVVSASRGLLRAAYFSMRK